jgi:arginase
MTTRITVLGAPSSAGAHYAGQELGPSAIRRAGFVKLLSDAGLDVIDAGDIQGEVFRVDPDPGAMRNLDAVVEVAERLADAVHEHVSRGYLPIVLGGDCTISLGIVAGLQRVHDDVGVAYIDGDADLSTPARTHSGILDASGVAHFLGLADTPLGAIGTTHPMLQPEQLVLLGCDPTDLDTCDADVCASHPELLHFTDEEIRADAAAAVSQARSRLAARTAVLVHFDVDCVDSADLPLANYPHYGSGLSLDTAAQLLSTMVGTGNLAAISLTEVNPTHDPGGEQLDRYVSAVATAIADGIRSI